MIPAASHARPPFYYVPVPTVVVPTQASSPTVYAMTTPATTHIVTHNKGYTPLVDVYTLAGERIYCDVIATDTTVHVQGNVPYTCLIIIW